MDKIKIKVVQVTTSNAKSIEYYDYHKVYGDITDWDEVSKSDYDLIVQWAKYKNYSVIKQVDVLDQDRKTLVSEIIDRANKEQKDKENYEKKYQLMVAARKEKAKIRALEKAQKLLKEAGKL